MKRDAPARCPGVLPGSLLQRRTRRVGIQRLIRVVAGRPGPCAMTTSRRRPWWRCRCSSAHPAGRVSAGLAQHVLAKFSVERLVAFACARRHGPRAVAAGRGIRHARHPGWLGRCVRAVEHRRPVMPGRAGNPYVLQACTAWAWGPRCWPMPRRQSWVQRRQPLWLTVNAGNGSGYPFLPAPGLRHRGRRPL